MNKYPYADHDKGMVLSQPRPGEFESEPMTPAQLAARDPALAIAKDIYRHANQAGVCYYEFWLLISDAIQGALDAAQRAEVAATQWKPDPQVMAREFASDCATLARWIKPNAPKSVKELAAGWLDDEERDDGPDGR